MIHNSQEGVTKPTPVCRSTSVRGHEESTKDTIKFEVKLHPNFIFFVISLCLLSARRDLAFLFLNGWGKKIQADKVGLVIIIRNRPDESAPHR